MSEVVERELYKLDPGSEEARAEGCICDPQVPRENDDGRKVWNVEKNCPVHGLAIMQELLRG